MTSAFSWQTLLNLCSASFCIPRPNLPVTPGVSWLPTYAFQSPIMTRMSFLRKFSKKQISIGNSYTQVTVLGLRYAIYFFIGLNFSPSPSSHLCYMTFQYLPTPWSNVLHCYLTLDLIMWLIFVNEMLVNIIQVETWKMLILLSLLPSSWSSPWEI